MVPTDCGSNATLVRDPNRAIPSVAGARTRPQAGN